MRTVVSADGTKIAFDLAGDGPPVILIVGAFKRVGPGVRLFIGGKSRPRGRRKRSIWRGMGRP